MKNIFLLIFFVAIVTHAIQAAVTEGYCHRVKRSNSMVNTTKTTNNVTTINTTTNPTSTAVATTIEKNKHLPNATTKKPKRDVDDEIATQIRSAIEKYKLTNTPATIHVRHVKLNRSEPAALRELRRNMEKERCSDIRRPKSLLLLNSRNAEESFDDEKNKDEKFFEFLTGKSGSNGESKHHHERYGRTFYVKDNSGKKTKRNAVKSSIHHKLHKDTKDHKHKRSENESPIDNFMRLTKMLVEMSGGNVRPDSSSLHAHNNNNNDVDSLSPIAGERLTEVIYKPMAIDAASGDDVALISSNEFLSNEFAGIPQPQHAILPLEGGGGGGYHEFALPLPLLSNFSPLKFLMNAVESGISLSTDKDENDSDEYEMTCPVHFKRSTDGIGGGGGSKDGNGGVLELCTCHLYRKKKQVL